MVSSQLEQDRFEEQLKQTIFKLRRECDELVNDKQVAIEKIASDYELQINQLQFNVQSLRNQLEKLKFEHKEQIEQCVQDENLNKTKLEFQVKELRQMLDHEVINKNVILEKHQLEIDHLTKQFKETIQKLRKRLDKKNG